MRFPKLTRTLIANAKGKPIEIVWPEGEPEPEKGGAYTVQSSAKRKGAYSVIVRDAFQGGDERWRAVVQVAEQQRPLRIKAKRDPDKVSMGGPQFRPELEPEQVDARFQRALDEEGQRKTLRCQEDHRDARDRRRRDRRADRSNLRPAA